MSSVPAVARSHATSLKADYKVAKAQLLERFRTATNVEGLMAALSRTTDDSLRAAWNTCELPAELALVAVGGFGRGELAPHSDIDILVLLPDAPLEHLEARIERFISLAWDLGLELGSSVRSVSQCLEEAANDVTVRTSLLEARRITGSAALFDDFAKRYREALDPKAFFQAKVLEMRQRHAKFQDTPYALEPNIKESPGGLRDLQLILWVTQAAGFGSSWRELEARGLITERE
ncbi:MAG: nucleotidyltransferase domain-containing protein, partial [Paraburkholderia graminis]